jgi:transaldolase
MNPLQRLCEEQRQSPWVDFIDRSLLDGGGLAALMASGIRGLTSNPTIFARAVATGQYDALVQRELDAGTDPPRIHQEIAVRDVRDAADVLRPIYEDSGGTDGFASIEVEPALADDTEGTVARALELWRLVDRPNIFVKIPGTPAGIPAIQRSLAAGVNVNVTLLFGVDVYREVARAYLGALQERLDRGEEIQRIASVASFFVSRVDAKIDARLDAIGTAPALAARGKAALANARRAYRAWGEIFHGPDFAPLLSVGARTQRCLWASTSTKNPAYRDVMYVEGLIGPDTVDTMPMDTIRAFLDHGVVERTVDEDPERIEADIDAVEAQGISLQEVTRELVVEGVATFAKSVDELLATIEQRGRKLAIA